jgi:hypothetical protein
VKATASGVAMFFQIKSIKGFKAGEAFCIGCNVQFFGAVHVGSMQ